MGEFRTDRLYWCEMCARQKECYGITLKPKCFVPKADRKTESSSEKPNNCEHITEDGVTCAKYPACDGCLENPLNKVKGSKRLLKGKTEPQTEETEIERLERIDNEIEDVWARIRELTDEPQTERQRLEGKRWTDALTIEEKKRLLEGFWIKDEPQSELCRDCKDYAGNGMFCAKNYMVYDFSRSVCKTESQERSE